MISVEVTSQWLEEEGEKSLTSKHEALGLVPVLYKLGMMMLACQDVEGHV